MLKTLKEEGRSESEKGKEDRERRMGEKQGRRKKERKGKWPGEMEGGGHSHRERKVKTECLLYLEQLIISL